MSEALKPSELGNALKICFQAGRAPMVHGDPGIGKSQIAQQTADLMFADKYGYKVIDGVLHSAEYNIPATGPKKKVWEYFPVPVNFERPWFKDVRAALLDAVDVRGLPTVNEGKVLWAIPGFLPTDERGGIFFLDEINRGTEMVANALFSLILDRTVGEYRMPDSWIPAAAVNDKDTGARKMSSALQARFIHLDARTDLDDVCKFAIQHNWEPDVTAFLRFRPGDLHNYEPTRRVSPNPRAWEFVSQIVAQNPPESVLFSLISGAVGEGAATEFVGFLKMYRELPSIDAIMLDPDRAQLVTTPQTMYAVAAALAHRATDRTFGQIVKYLNRLPIEFNVLCVKDAVIRCTAIQSTKEFTRWCTDNKDVTF
jgi:hypothetical protein